MQCDVFSSTDIGHYVELKAKDLLEKYVPDNASKVLDIYKNYDPDGYYFVTSAGMIGIGYNTAKVKEADAPKNWTDLLDPKWKNNIALGPPRLQRLCRHLGADAAQAIRLGVLREAREEQSADRPLDQRHRHDAQCRRKRQSPVRPGRHAHRERRQRAIRWR